MFDKNKKYSKTIEQKKYCTIPWS